MKTMRISQRKSMAATILVLTIIFLLPVTAPAGKKDLQRPDIQKPATFKPLFKKMEAAPKQAGAQLSYLFKLQVPVELKKVHPSVEKAAIYCFISKSDPSGPDSWGQGLAEIPLQGGSYNGIINVYITELARSFYSPELIDKWECALIFKVNGETTPVLADSQSIELAHKFGTLFQTNVKGNF